MLKHMLKSLIVLFLSFFTFLLSRLLHFLREDVNITFNDFYTIFDISDNLTC
jgi:hypothetical protein